MDNFTVQPIGVIHADDHAARILLAPAYAPALRGLEGFSHVQVLWWFSQCDDEASRASLQEQSPYKRGPRVLGVFATRSPLRPNPIALSCAEVLRVDADLPAITLAHTDAAHGSPVLDIKPYTPSLDRVFRPRTPDWCAHWPGSLEDSGSFDWSGEFMF